MTKVVMVVKGQKVDKVAFVPHAILEWAYNTDTKSSGIISLPKDVLAKVEEFYGKAIDNEIAYHSMSFEEDVMAHFHKLSDVIKGVKNAEVVAAEKGFDIVDDFFIGKVEDFILSEQDN